MKIIEAKATDLEMLYGNSAVTLIGLSSDSIGDWVNWLGVNGYIKNDDTLEVYTITGELMNVVYGLTGSNAYADDLTIVSISLEHIANCNKLAIDPVRWQVGYRWFDDVVDNNRMREEEE